MDWQRQLAETCCAVQRSWLAIVLTSASVAWGSTPQPHAAAVNHLRDASQEPVATDPVYNADVTCGTTTVFRGFDNVPLDAANLSISNDELIVSNLGTTTTPITTCTPPQNGVEVCPGSLSQLAGDYGAWVEQVATLIPTAVTSYFVQLGGYWGIADSMPPWVTAPIPIGFRTGSNTVTCCADFNVCPIRCDNVEVEFKLGPSTGKMVCPSGDLFSVSTTSPITLGRVFVRGLCIGGYGNCDPAKARARAAIVFVFDSVVTGISPMMPGCMVTAGTSPFSAAAIVIKPQISSCQDSDAGCTEPTCCGGAGSAAALGGTTPPILGVRLTAVGVEDAAAAAASTVGAFRILDEAICTVTETAACGDGVDNDCDGLVDLADPDCTLSSIPAISTWGLAVFTIGLCLAAALLLRRARGAMVRARSA